MVLISALDISSGLGYVLKPFLKDEDYYPSEIERTVYQLQKSVLVTPWECEDEIDFISVA